MAAVITDESNGGFALTSAWRLHPRVALRPEPFGALAYHYDNRKLNFLRSHDLVAVVEQLAQHNSVQAALDAVGVAPARQPAFAKALAGLASGNFLEERP